MDEYILVVSPSLEEKAIEVFGDMFEIKVQRILVGDDWILVKERKSNAYSKIW